MTYSESNYQGSAISSNNQAAFTFGYLNVSEIRVDITVGSTTTTYTSTSSPAGFTVVSPNQYVTLSSHPADSDTIRVYRVPSLASPQSTFVSGSPISANSLNNNYKQVLQASQESRLEASTATTTANTAKTTADSATTTANTASSTANTATTTANSAVTTANSAVTTANTATTTANSAVTTANTAVTTANAASATATAAQNAVSSAAFYTPVANVAGIPGSPANEDRVEVADSTGIQSFTPLTGYPTGFVGAAGLTARIQYTTSGNTWNWVDYFANDSESRYLTVSQPVVKGDATTGSGELTLNCENNSHGIKLKGPPHSAAATYTLTLPNNTGTNGQLLTTNGSGTLTWSTVTGIIVADGGNFDSGSSLVSTSTTYDGGSFD